MLVPTPTMDLQKDGIEVVTRPGLFGVKQASFDIKFETEDNNAVVKLGWRSWIAVFVTCFSVMTQAFVVTAAGSVVAFIVRDLGDGSIAGWVIQGSTSVLSPVIGRLSDVLDRKYLASIPPLIALVGAVISAKATSMAMLVGGGVLIGTTLSTIAIVQAIPSEVLPLKYRALANALGSSGGAIGGIVGVLSAGGVTNASPSGWRNIFWIQAALHGASTLGLLLFYHPLRRSDYPKMSFKQYVWACDPIGSALFMTSTTLMLLALDWAGGAYLWHDAHVAVPLSLGLALLLSFCLYEYKGRDDGLVAHAFFQGGPNFMLSVFAYAVEGWLFYGAVNSITPQIVLNLGFENSAWRISVRQQAFSLSVVLVSIPIALYSTRYKDLKSPLLVTFTIFLVVAICYATITPNENHAQIGFNVLSGIGQSAPLTLLIALVQFTAPHAFLSTATGLAFSARAIGGAFGSAVLDAIINSKLRSTYAAQVSQAAIAAGLPESSVASLLAAFTSRSPEAFDDVPGLNSTILASATDASHWAYAYSYRLAWTSIIPFIVLALISVACLRGVRELMTDRIEATVEHTDDKESRILKV